MNIVVLRSVLFGRDIDTHKLMIYIQFIPLTES
jgi:hypothetical protein